MMQGERPGRPCSTSQSQWVFLDRDQGPVPLFSISLHPASGGKGSLLGQGVVGEVQGGPRNYFRDAGAGYTCDDDFRKEVDSQLGGKKRYTAYSST
ncbi:hypothetical protein TNCV_1845701 [Trichonephila clavipes]|nr:hypothetical protein TNCV_1845701 [Trichonephila clavipes]